jgi:hypothetical protein
MIFTKFIWDGTTYEIFFSTSKTLLLMFYGFIHILVIGSIFFIKVYKISTDKKFDQTWDDMFIYGLNIVVNIWIYVSYVHYSVFKKFIDFE